MKNIAKILCFVLALATVFTLIGVTTFAEDPADVTISTLDELKTFRDAVNAGNDYAGKYVKLAADIDLGGEEWAPIGNGTRSSKTYSGNAFKGTFDGGNFTVSGLNITSTTGADVALGLFGVVDGGTVKNLKLANVNINVASSNLTGGAIGMMLNGATADNITVDGAIVGNDGVGGIAGRMIISGTISNCTNNASVTSNYGGIGGIVGKPYYEDSVNTSVFASIINCTNNGTITAPMYVGGIAGLARANVTGCTNNGAVVGGTQTGGIVGQLIAAGTVSGNVNNAKIAGKNHMGGIIGDYTQSSSYTYYNVAIANNINNGELAATESCAAIMGCNNISGFTGMTASGNLSYYYVDGLKLFLTPYNMVIDDTNKFVVVKVGDVEYVSFDEALTAANALTGNVTVEIYGKVTLNSNLSGSYDSIKFVGKTENAEIYLEVQGYITATGKSVAFEDLKLSKSAGGFITNAGFMNVAFGVYDVNTVNYTNCVFANGAYASSGVVTFDGCTFYRSHDKYGLWAYGNVESIVKNCVFDDYRGIKMYAEGAEKTTELTVTNTDFTKLDSKPAIVLTYGESVVLENNTYSSTGVFELDLDGAPNGTEVTSDVPVTCKNDNGACGVLVDGKIYTTVAQAAAVATAGSNVTLLHESTEDVEFSIGVTVDKNGFTAENITVAVPVAKIGDVEYSSLQKAIDAVQNGDEIILLADITENVNTTEKNGLYYTINGNGKQMKGTITNSALSNINDNRRITIKNINFVTEAGCDFITSTQTNYYPRLTVEGCTFTGTGNDDTTAIRVKSSHSLIIKNCSGTKLHSFLQNTSGWNLTVDNVTVTDSKSGLALGTVQGVTVSNCDIDVRDYGIRLDAQYNNNAVIESNTVDSFIPVVVRKASVDSNITFSGTNAMTASNTDGLWCAIGTTEYEENGVLPSAPTAKVRVTNNDAGLDTEGLYGNFIAVATVNGVEYGTLAEAFAAAQDGDTIVLLADLVLDTETFTVADGVSITLDMNGKKIAATDNKTSGNYELFYIRGEMTVTGNGTIELTATTDREWNAMSAIFHNRGGVLNILNGSFTHNGGTDMAYVVDNSANSYGDATTNISGGKLVSYYIGIRNRMDTYGANGGGNGIAILNISGGEISGKYAVWGQVSSAGCKGQVDITGGTFTAHEGKDAILMETDSTGEIETVISGGTFSSDVSAYCAAGFAPVWDAVNKCYAVLTQTLSYSIRHDTVNGVEGEYWFFGDVNTGVIAQPKVYIEYVESDAKYYWFINGTNTGVVAQPTHGHNPEVTIVNGYFALDGETTSISAVGVDGVSVVSIVCQSSDAEAGIDTYVITYSNGNTVTFSVQKGQDGNQGAAGDRGEEGPQGPKGDQGVPGPNGADNNWVVTIALIISGVSVVAAVIIILCLNKKRLNSWGKSNLKLKKK